MIGLKGGQVFIWEACMVSLDDSRGLSKTWFSPCMAISSRYNQVASLTFPTPVLAPNQVGNDLVHVSWAKW